MKVIGILGGVASGKSSVAKQFRQLGAEVLDADGTAHQVLQEPEVKAELRNRWGDAVFDEHGSVDRSVVAKIVFAEDDEGARELRFLEKLVHPRIGERLRQRMHQIAHEETAKFAILDAAVMLKAGWNQICDKIVFVDVPRELRLSRAMERGWSAEHFEAREKAQESLEVKRKLADAVIDNSGDSRATLKQIQDLLRTWEAEDASS